MKRALRRVALLASATALAGATAVPPATAEPAGASLASARAATAQFHRIDVAVAAGYGEFRDAAGIACIDKPGSGAMGIHYVNGALVGDGVADAQHPEAVIYEPQSDGRMRLVGLEYVVIAATWTGSSAPSLFGQPFELVGSPNRYGLPPFYALHAWVWHHNPAGTFADWNPTVSCP